jgi:hypothetical protein
MGIRVLKGMECDLIHFTSIESEKGNEKNEKTNCWPK